MTEFTPVPSLMGGMLIGISSALMLMLHGRIAGISGIVGNLLGGGRRDAWRLAFVLGMLAGGLVIFAFAPARFGMGLPTGLPTLAIAGALVGLGTRLGSGCTSGHGVCGISRLSTRSFVATGVFMFVAGVTVFVTHHLGDIP